MPSSPQQSRVPQELGPRALEALAGRTRADDLVLVDEASTTSEGETVYRFTAARKSDGNGPQFTIVLDAKGQVLEGRRLAAVGGAVPAEETGTLEPDDGTVRPTDPGTVSTLAATIDPTFNDLVLNPGDTFGEVITVTIPPGGPARADVYFLADTTGSMGSHIAAVQAGANQILTDLNALGVDLAYGVGNYKDFPFDAYAFDNQLSPTTNTAAVTAAINAWAAGGGNDTPEGQFFAFHQLSTGAVAWRPGAERILVWFGDAPSHDPICTAYTGLATPITEASVTAELQAAGITVLAISVTTPGLDANPLPMSTDYSCAPAGSAGQATRIAAATGGTFATGVNASAIVSTITTLVTAAVTTINNVSLVPTGAIIPFVTSITPAGGYGPLATDVQHVLPFDVLFTGTVPCTAVPQVFAGTLDVVADGVVIAVKQVRITVPACETKRFVYSVKYVCGTAADESGCPVRPGSYATEVNIHNPNLRDARVEKLFLPLVINGEPKGREPDQVRPQAKDQIFLSAQSATMDDCCRIAELLGLDLGALQIGFIQISSDAELNVVAVYTASGFEYGGPVSIDVEEVRGRIV